MILLHLRVRNFRTHADTSIPFKRGVTGIVGTNEAGKSNLAEALAWGFYGAQAIRGTKKGIRREGAPPGAEASVTIIFVLGANKYMLDRSETAARLWVKPAGEGVAVEPVDGALPHEEHVAEDASFGGELARAHLYAGICIAEGQDAVTEKVTEILGRDYKDFVTSHLILQKDIDRFLVLKPVERHTYVRRMMRIGSVDEALTSCRTATNALGQRVAGAEAALGDRPDARVDELADDVSAAEIARDEAADVFRIARDALTRLSAEKEELDGRRAQRAEQDARLQGLFEQRGDTRLRIEQLERMRAEERGAIQTLALAERELQPLDRLVDEEKELETARQADEETVRLSDAILEARADLQEAEDARDTTANAAERDASTDEEAFEAVRFAVEHHRALLASRMEQKTRLETECEAHHAEIDRNRRRIEAIVDAGSDGGCPTCLRPLREAYDVVIQSLQDNAELQRRSAEFKSATLEGLANPSDAEQAAERQAQALVATRVALQTEIAMAEKAAAELPDKEATVLRLSARLQALEGRLERMPPIVYDGERHATVKAEVARLVSLRDSLSEARAKKLRADSTMEQLGEAGTHLASVEGRIKALEEILVEFDDQEHAAVGDAVRRATGARDRAESDFGRAEGSFLAARAVHEEAIEALRVYDERAQALTTERESLVHHKAAVQGLTGFRLAVAGTIRPELEEYVSGFLAILTDGLHETVELREDFSVVAYENGRAMEVVSGGAEDLVALSMRLAMMQMHAERAGHPLSLLWADEIFSAQAEERRGNILSLFGRLGEVFEQVILTSHVAETKDAVDHAIILERGADGATHIVN